MLTVYTKLKLLDDDDVCAQRGDGSRVHVQVYAYFIASHAYDYAPLAI